MKNKLKFLTKQSLDKKIKTKLPKEKLLQFVM